MLRRPAIALLLIGLAALPARADVVLELFTSQGCPHCPAADAYLGQIKDREGIVALSLPVDYWDPLGWEDTLASSANSERQRGYATVAQDLLVYTPQMVVGGRVRMIGSDQESIEAAILAAGNTTDISVTMTYLGGAVRIVVGDASTIARASIWVAYYSSGETVPITRGYNANKTLTYHNVVREMHRLAMWRGGEWRVELPIAEMTAAGADGIAILVQSDVANSLPGPIIGAAAIEPAL